MSPVSSIWGQFNKALHGTVTTVLKDKSKRGLPEVVTVAAAAAAFLLLLAGD